jgi:hypothetical protein
LVKRIDDARKEAEAIEARNRQIQGLLTQAKLLEPQGALPLLEKAYALDRGRDDVLGELERVRKLAAPPPPPPPPPDLPSDEARVRQTMIEYVAAYNSMDAKRVQLLKRSFKGYPPHLKTARMAISNLVVKLSADRQTANVGFTVQYQYEWLKGAMPGAENPNPQRLDWQLVRTPTGWIID